jgi:cytochrome c oxidase subunit 4
MQLAKPAIARHVVSWKVYVTVFVLLAILTTLSVVVTGFDFGPLNLMVALGVAATKSALVVLYFMHVRYSTRLTWAVVAGGFFWLALLLLLTLGDYLTRGPGWLRYG